MHHFNSSTALASRIAPNVPRARSSLATGLCWLAGIVVTALIVVALLIGAVSGIAFLASRAHAQEAKKPPLTNAQALNLLVSLRALEGHDVIIKQNGADLVVRQPWDFGSALLRLRIKRNIQQLEPIEKAIKDTRESMIVEALGRMPVDKEGKKPTAIPPGTGEFDAFLKQLTEVLEKPVDGQVDMVRIRASELKLDRNDIGSSTLLGLDPILDDDVTPK